MMRRKDITLSNKHKACAVRQNEEGKGQGKGLKVVWDA
jgi:hypothetical protein